MVMASTKVARAAAQLHEAAQDVARVAASRNTQPEDMTMNGWALSWTLVGVSIAGALSARRLRSAASVRGCG